MVFDEWRFCREDVGREKDLDQNEADHPAHSASVTWFGDLHDCLNGTVCLDVPDTNPDSDSRTW
jgi:hypothetical protein